MASENKNGWKSSNKGRTSTLELDSLEVTVTRYVDYGDELVMHCSKFGINKRPLGTEDFGKGQRKAFDIVMGLAKQMYDDVLRFKVDNTPEGQGMDGDPSCPPQAGGTDGMDGAPMESIESGD